MPPLPKESLRDFLQRGIRTEQLLRGNQILTQKFKNSQNFICTEMKMS
jgi:hypothetical protein